MPLVNPTVGDLADRLTIVTLKLLHYGAAGKPVDHLRAERAALLTQLRSRDLSGPWLEPLLELGAVNGALWTATDQLREWDAPHANLKGLTEREWPVVGELGLRILRLNDHRAQLIEAINKLTGDHRGSEKGGG